MASFDKAFEKLKKLEFKNCSNVLHKNKTENYYTFAGVYQKYHTNLNIWSMVVLYKNIGLELEDISKILYCNKEIWKEVKEVYKKEYWDKIKGDYIKNQHIADEIFIFAVNSGVETAVKTAQKIVGVVPDGIVGPKTLRALNSYNSSLFDHEYDSMEINFYKRLVNKIKKFKIYLTGWINRAKAV